MCFGRPSVQQGFEVVGAGPIPKPKDSLEDRMAAVKHLNHPDDAEAWMMQPEFQFKALAAGAWAGKASLNRFVPWRSCALKACPNRPT